MAHQKIVMPTEGAGKQIHTREITVDIGGTPTVVQQEYVIPTSARVASGIYLATTGVSTVTSAADTFPAGRWFLVNPVGSTIKVALRHVQMHSHCASAAVRASSPRLLLVAFTFTGSPSGATITPRRAFTTFAAPTGSLRTASTGLTITRTQDVAAFLPWAAVTAVDASRPAESTWCPPEDEQIVLAAGEGILLTQADAGTTSDNRRYVNNLVWAEYTAP